MVSRPTTLQIMEAICTYTWYSQLIASRRLVLNQLTAWPITTPPAEKTENWSATQNWPNLSVLPVIGTYVPRQTINSQRRMLGQLTSSAVDSHETPPS